MKNADQIDEHLHELGVGQWDRKLLLKSNFSNGPTQGLHVLLEIHAQRDHPGFINVSTEVVVVDALVEEHAKPSDDRIHGTVGATKALSLLELFKLL